MQFDAAPACKIVHMIQWDDVRIFLAVQRQRSYAKAARELGVVPTTLSRRVAELEASLEATLLERTPSGLAPTAAGEALAARAARMEEEMVASERELRGRDARLEGTVIVTAGDAIASHLLVPWLVDFRRLHPGIAVDLRADNRALDLTRREADVAVRLFRPRESSLVAQRAGEMPFALYGSEAYFARRARPRQAAELAGHEWIAWDPRIESSPQSRWLSRQVPRARVVLRANTTAALVAACAAGHGLAVLPTFVAESEPRLVQVLARVSPPPRPVWIATHADARKSARVQAMVEWLASRLRARG